MERGDDTAKVSRTLENIERERDFVLNTKTNWMPLKTRWDRVLGYYRWSLNHGLQHVDSHVSDETEHKRFFLFCKCSDWSRINAFRTQQRG